MVEIKPLSLGWITAAAVLSTAALTPAAWGQAQGQGRAVVMSSPQQPAAAPQKTPLQRLRELLGLNPPIAVGGSRSGKAVDVCVISPHLVLDGNGESVATVAIGHPTLLAAGPLNEARIERGGTTIWQRLASSTAAIEGPITWPLDPLQPGETVDLKLRPRGSAGADFAVIRLKAAPAKQMQQAAVLVQGLAADPALWQRAIEQQLDQGRVALAWELLFDQRSPRSPSLDELRRLVVQRGCGS